MAGEQQVHAIGEILTWLEQQLREAREDQSRDAAYLDQLRREVYELSDAVERNERAVREVDPKLLPYQGLPEKIRSLDEASNPALRGLLAAALAARKRGRDPE